VPTIAANNTVDAAQGDSDVVDVAFYHLTQSIHIGLLHAAF
jgi:hypothetical protein